MVPPPFQLPNEHVEANMGPVQHLPQKRHGWDGRCTRPLVRSGYPEFRNECQRWIQMSDISALERERDLQSVAFEPGDCVVGFAAVGTERKRVVGARARTCRFRAPWLLAEFGRFCRTVAPCDCGILQASPICASLTSLSRVRPNAFWRRGFSRRLARPVRTRDRIGRDVT